MKLHTFAVVAGSMLVAVVAGCQDSTAPRSGRFSSRTDRGLNVDTQSPSVPVRGGAGLGATQSNLPQGDNAPVPAGLRDTAPPPASPAADRAPGSDRPYTPPPAP